MREPNRAARASRLLLVLCVSVVLAITLMPTTGHLALGRVLARTSAPPNASPAAGLHAGAVPTHSSVATVPAYSSDDWTNITTYGNPPPGIAMAYDEAARAVLLFGGYSGGALYNDTWEFANGTWTKITTQVGTPPPAGAMAMAYDAADGYVVAEGCASVNAYGACDDTWSFGNGTWEQLPVTTTDNYGTPRSGWLGTQVSMAYDAADRYVVATNSQETWRFANGSWSRFCGGLNGSNCSSDIPGPGSTAAHGALWGELTYDAHDGYVVFYGTDPCNACSLITGNYTWKFAGGNWTNITASAGAAPSPRLDFSLGYDSSTGAALLLGGYGGAWNPSRGFTILNDTWVFRNGSWAQIAPLVSPPPSHGGLLADDPADSALVALLPTDNQSQFWTSPTESQTWVWGAAAPIAGLAIQATPAVPLPMSPVAFDASFVGGVRPFHYNWSFGDGATSTATNPSHAYASVGYYNVRVRVNDSGGHSQTASSVVHVYVPLALSNLTADPSPAPLGTQVNFTVNTTGGTLPYTYSWVFGDGGVGGNLSAISHIFTTNGPFLTTVQVTDAAASSARSTINVTIALSVIAGANSSAGLAPLPVGFVGQVVGGIQPFTFSWSFGDGTPNSLRQNPTHLYSTPGNYTAQLEVTDARGSSDTSVLLIHAYAPNGPTHPSPGKGTTTGLATPPSWAIWATAGTAIAAAVMVGTVGRIRKMRQVEGEQIVATLMWNEEVAEHP